MAKELCSGLDEELRQEIEAGKATVLTMRDRSTVETYLEACRTLPDVNAEVITQPDSSHYISRIIKTIERIRGENGGTMVVPVVRHEAVRSRLERGTTAVVFRFDNDADMATVRARLNHG